MFRFSYAYPQGQNTAPAVPPSEPGCTGHRVSLGADTMAYVFTRATRLADSLLHPDHVAFVNPDRRVAEASEPDFDQMTEASDYPAAAARACAGLPPHVDKVVVFAPDDCPRAVIRQLCADFGARAYPGALDEPPAQAARSASAAQAVPRRYSPETYGLCG